MIHYLALYWYELVALVYDMAPWLLLGFGIAGILHVFFPEGKINKLLGDSSMKHVFRAAIFGIPLPLCSCGVIPTGISIYRSGASKGASIAFLISTPQTGVDSVMVTYSLLGLPFAILRPIIALVTGVLGGILANFFERDKVSPGDTPIVDASDASDASIKGPSEQSVAPPSCCQSGSAVSSCSASSRESSGHASHTPHIPHDINSSWFTKTREALRYAMVDFFGDVARSLLLGLLIAAGIAVLVPADFFASYLQNDLIGMLVILVASIPLYVCATSSVPVAAVLIAKGLSPGAAIVFLMAGPATNAATITMIGSVMGRRALFTYLGTIVGGALFFGLITDYFLPRAWFVPTMTAHAHGHDALLPAWLQISSSIVFVIALGYALFRQFVPKRFLGGKKKLVPDEKTTLLKVQGMTCGHCKRTVEETVRQLDGVEDAEADLSHATLAIRGTPDLAQVRQSLESVGFEVEE